MLGPECTVRPIETWNKHRTVTVSNSIKQHRTASKSNSIEIEQHRNRTTSNRKHVSVNQCGMQTGRQYWCKDQTFTASIRPLSCPPLRVPFGGVCTPSRTWNQKSEQQTFSTNHSVEVATRQYWCCTTAAQLLHNCYTTPLTKPHPSGAIPTFVLSPTVSGRRCPPPSPAEHWSAG